MINLCQQRHTYICTDAGKQMYMYGLLQTCTHIHTPTYRLTQEHIHTYSCTNLHTHTQTQVYSKYIYEDIYKRELIRTFTAIYYIYSYILAHRNTCQYIRDYSHFIEIHFSAMNMQGIETKINICGVRGHLYLPVTPKRRRWKTFLLALRSPQT
jgi:hypothetical protein